MTRNKTRHFYQSTHYGCSMACIVSNYCLFIIFLTFNKIIMFLLYFIDLLRSITIINNTTQFLFNLGHITAVSYFIIFLTLTLFFPLMTKFKTWQSTQRLFLSLSQSVLLHKERDEVQKWIGRDEFLAAGLQFPRRNLPLDYGDPQHTIDVNANNSKNI